MSHHRTSHLKNAMALACALLVAPVWAQQAAAPAVPTSAAAPAARPASATPVVASAAARAASGASTSRTPVGNAAQAASANVEKMLAVDGEQAVRKFLEEAAKAGVTGAVPPASGAPVGATPGGRPEPKPEPVWTVRSIFGAGGALQADIAVDGIVSYSTSAGATVGKCKVLAIAERCVTLEPPKDKRGKPVRGLCPASACWTGQELSAELRPNQTGAAPVAAATPPLPSGGRPPLPPNAPIR
jgi:hypothetical protein